MAPGGSGSGARSPRGPRPSRAAFKAPISTSFLINCAHDVSAFSSFCSRRLSRADPRGYTLYAASHRGIPTTATTWRATRMSVALYAFMQFLCFTLTQYLSFTNIDCLHLMLFRWPCFILMDCLCFMLCGLARLQASVRGLPHAFCSLWSMLLPLALLHPSFWPCFKPLD